MYVLNTPADVPKCNLGPQTLGAVTPQAPGPSTLQLTTGLMLVGGGALLAGWALSSLVSGGTRSFQRKRVRLRKRMRKVSKAVGELGRQAIDHQTPTWQALLLVGIGTAAVYLITTRVLKGGQQG